MVGDDMDKIPFTEKDVKEYLDECIKYWREIRDNNKSTMANHYIDAFQSVRTSLFGDILPPEKI